METRQDIAYLSDLGDAAIVPSQAVQGNIVLFGDDNVLQDSGKKPSDYPETADTARMISDAVGALKTAVDGEYAISAYKAAEWAPGTLYYSGSFCIHDNVGYRCIEEHVSGLFFDVDKWKVVLSADGKSALDALLSDYPKVGLAALSDIAPIFNADTEYIVGQLAVVDGKLKICRRAGRGAAAQFEDSTVEEALSIVRGEIARIKSSIKQADWNVSSSSDPAFIRNKPAIAQADWDQSASSDPAFIRNKPIIPDAQVQADWDESASSDPAFIRNKPEIPEIPDQVQADWDESASSDPAFIRNKPEIPEIPDQVQADWDESASSDPAFIRNKPDIPDANYRLAYLSPEDTSTPNVLEAQLEDRAVNVIVSGLSGTNTVRLIPPASGGLLSSRDFYVVLEAEFDSNATVVMPGAVLEDCAGGSVTLSAPAGVQATYRMTEVFGFDNVFVVSLYADPAKKDIKEAERAMDDILNNEGVATFTPGVFLPEDGTNKYYRISAVKESWGEVVVGISQHGTPYGDGGVNPDGSDSSSNSSSDDGSSDPAQNVILELASRNYVDDAVDDAIDGMHVIFNLFADETMSAYPTQAQIAEVVKRLFELFGGTVQ